MQHLRLPCFALGLLVSASALGCASGGVEGHDAGDGRRDATAHDDGGGSCGSSNECDDGDPCNGTETCADGRCAAGTAIDCDDAIDCTADACASDGSCTHNEDDSACEADQVCDATAGCVPPPPCTTDEDSDDGLTCNGVETCDPATGCQDGDPPACDDSVSCTTDSCDDGAGGCVHTPDPEPCQDGVFCHGAEVCDATAGCMGGTAPTCDDGIDCTVGHCDTTSDACVQEADPAFCPDGLVCNGVEQCDVSGATPGRGCVAGTPIDCSDGLACTTDVCSEPDGSCSHSGSDADGDGHEARGCGSGDDCNDLNGAIHPGAAELCDGVDNDCSDVADDGPGMACAVGSGAQSCTTGCGTIGARTCTAACTLSACVASEACNGCDDDGNGVSDDGFACRQGAPASCVTGCGTTGTQICNSSCSGYGTCRATEVCNGCDDDAANGPDDGFTCVAGASTSCTNPCGVSGTHTCNGSCSGYSACVAASEVCGNSCDDNGDGTVNEGCGPTNNTCAAATVLSGTSGTRSDVFDGATATVSDCASGAELWYRITLGARSVLYLDTFGSSFDTRISVRSACGGSYLGCEDDDCGTFQDVLARDLAAGTYYVAVHAWSSSTTTGTVNLRWQTLPTGNGAATRVTAAGTYSGTTSGTGITSSCVGAGPEDLFYFTVCPSTTTTVGASTCGGATWDTVLYLRSSSGTDIACNDDTCNFQSTISGSVSGPGLYGVFVDGLGSSSGPYSVAISGL